MKVGVGKPVQVPGFAVKTEPTVAVPVIVGATVLAGAAGIPTVDSELIAAVPAVLVAVTRTDTYWPPSAATNVYVAAVAAAITTQPAGTVSEVTVCWVVHRYQARVNVGAGEPVQVPVVEVKTEPTVAVPVITGATVLAGAWPTVAGVDTEIR